MNRDHLTILQRGVKTWNNWRTANPSVTPNLAGAQLQGAELRFVNFRGAILQGATFRRAYLSQADFRHANLRAARFVQAYLRNTDFTRANLQKANLTGASLFRSTLVSADLTEATLAYASLVEAKCHDAIFDHSRVYGVSAWNVSLERASQTDLRISADHEPAITVDSLELAQFLYLLINNKNLRQIINTITSKAVLILGRFTAQRKQILNAIRDRLRSIGYVPMMFDFDKPANQTTMETVSTLAGMARFVIADLTDAKSVLQELRDIVPARPSVPVQPILLSTDSEPGMFDYFRRFPWVLQTYQYRDESELLEHLHEQVVAPAERYCTQVAKTGTDRPRSESL